MPRGLLVVVSGFLPILFLIMLGNSVDRVTGNLLAGLGLLCTSALFIAGTALIATEKGHPLAKGLLLGLIAPLGTAIAVLLPDQKNQEAAEQPATTSEVASKKRLARSRKASGFDKLMQVQQQILWPSSGVIGVLIAILTSWHLLSFKGGIPAGKVFFGLSMGAFYAMAYCGTIVFWPLVFAPQNWLLNTERGRIWMQRTGLKNPESTIPLRLMSLVIAIISSGMFGLFIFVVIETATKRPVP